MIDAIRNSDDLAVVLNAQPLTAADAAETPRDWLDGIWVAGTVYDLDPDATTDTLAVLANGTAAVVWSPEGVYCGYDHSPYSGNYNRDGHWCPADVEAWSYGDARGVRRDWRTVFVWDSNGTTDTTVYPTVEEAKAAYERECEEMEQFSKELDALYPDMKELEGAYTRAVAGVDDE